jgi:hypothetical protein
MYYDNLSEKMISVTGESDLPVIAISKYLLKMSSNLGEEEEIIFTVICSIMRIITYSADVHQYLRLYRNVSL